MPKSTITLTVDDPISTLEGPIENGVPEILTVEKEPVVINPETQEVIPFHCADTVARDGGIEDFEKVDGTVFDDQS